MNPRLDLPALYAVYPRPLWLLWSGTLINRAGEFVVPLLGFYLTAQQHMDIGQVSVILSALGVGRFVAESVSGQLSDRHGTDFTMKLALTGGALILLLLAQAHTFAHLFDGVLTYSLLTALYKPARRQHAPQSQHGVQGEVAERLAPYHLPFEILPRDRKVAAPVHDGLRPIAVRQPPDPVWVAAGPPRPTQAVRRTRRALEHLTEKAQRFCPSGASEFDEQDGLAKLRRREWSGWRCCSDARVIRRTALERQRTANQFSQGISG